MPKPTENSLVKDDPVLIDLFANSIEKAALRVLIERADNELAIAWSKRARFTPTAAGGVGLNWYASICIAGCLEDSADFKTFAEEWLKNRELANELTAEQSKLWVAPWVDRFIENSI